MSGVKFVPPTGFPLQCSVCNVPVETCADPEFTRDSVTLLVEPCGHRGEYGDIPTRNYSTLVDEVWANAAILEISRQGRRRRWWRS